MKSFVSFVIITCVVLWSVTAFLKGPGKRLSVKAMHKLDDYYMRLRKESQRPMRYILNPKDYQYKKLLEERRAYIEASSRKNSFAHDIAKGLIANGLVREDSIVSAAQKMSDGLAQKYTDHYVTPHLEDWVQQKSAALIFSSVDSSERAPATLGTEEKNASKTVSATVKAAGATITKTVKLKNLTVSDRMDLHQADLEVEINKNLKSVLSYTPEGASITWSFSTDFE